ncbi:MAG: hypothetical protein ABIJ22_00395 [Patescibacteria group bacterium]
MTHSPLLYLKKTISWLIQHWLIIFISSLVFLLILSAILRTLTPPTPPSHHSNAWNSIVPGISSVADVTKQLGQPSGVTKNNYYTTLQYSSDFPTIPTQVGINKSGVVIFIKERLVYDKNHTLEQYINQFNQPELSLFVSDASIAAKAYVFLDEGLVVIAHTQDNTVEQKWYFSPTNQQSFLQSWENELSQNQPGPEKFLAN